MKTLGVLSLEIIALDNCVDELALGAARLSTPKHNIITLRSLPL
jgi:hypothetical protein